MYRIYSNISPGASIFRLLSRGGPILETGLLFDTGFYFFDQRNIKKFQTKSIIFGDF